jgi:hypothetical protein
VSTEAKNWASDQHPGRPLWKLVLIGTCNYVNKHTDKTSAHPATVAEWCDIPRAQTVSDAQQQLASKGFLIDTGERIGRNGQTIVWRLGWKKHSHATDTPLARDSHATDNTLTTPNVGSDVGKVGTEPITDKPSTTEPNGFHTLGNSLAEDKRTGEARPISSFLVREKESLESGKQWEEYAEWCWSNGGKPTKKGFETWKRTQANRHKGYVLDGKFFTEKQANEKARNNQELIDRMRKATRINGKITIL